MLVRSARVWRGLGAAMVGVLAFAAPSVTAQDALFPPSSQTGLILDLNADVYADFPTSKPIVQTERVIVPEPLPLLMLILGGVVLGRRVGTLRARAG